MLRNSHRPVQAASGAVRAVAVACVIFAGIVVAGVRPQAADRTEEGKTTTQTRSIDLAYVPDNAAFVVALRPAAILARAKQIGLHDLEFLLDRGGPIDLPLQGIEVDQIEQLTMHFSVTKPYCERTILRMTQVVQLAELVPGDAEAKKFADKTYFATNRYGFCQLDSHTIACWNRVGGARLEPFFAASRGNGPAFLADKLRRQVESTSGILALNWQEINTEMFKPGAELPPSPATDLLLAPPMNEVKIAVLGLRVNDHLEAHAIIRCKSKEGTAKVQDTVHAYKVLGRNMLLGQLSHKSNMDEVREVCEQFFESFKIERQGPNVQVSAAIPISEDWPKRFAVPILAARRAAQRSKSINNLKRLGLAMHNYHDTYKSFPPAVLYGPDGKTPHSWRVAILPYLGQVTLYKRYRFDEPWDGPNNRKLLEEVPEVFRHPGLPSNSRNASYFGLVGSGTIFEDEKGCRIVDIRDGLSNTLMLVEAKRDIPWTKPEDIPYDPEKPMPEPGGFTEGGFHAAYCDGSVRFLGKEVPEATLRALISVSGREPIERY